MAQVLKLAVEKADGSSVSLSLLPKTIVAFERHFGVGLSALQQGHMEHVYWLAWDAENLKIRAQGGVTKLFDDWLDDIADVEVEGDVTPLVQGRSPAE